MDHQSGASKEQRNDGGGEVRYAGVVFQSGKYGARIHDKAKKRGVWLGTFPTAEEAARAYDQAAIARGRHINCLNFPEEHPDAAAAAGGATNASTMTAAAAAGGAAPPILPLIPAEQPDAAATGAANVSTMTAAAATATSSSSTSSMATREVTDEYNYLKGLKLDDLGVLPHLDDDKVNKYGAIAGDNRRSWDDFGR